MQSGGVGGAGRSGSIRVRLNNICPWGMIYLFTDDYSDIYKANIDINVTIPL